MTPEKPKSKIEGRNPLAENRFHSLNSGTGFAKTSVGLKDFCEKSIKMHKTKPTCFQNFVFLDKKCQNSVPYFVTFAGKNNFSEVNQ
jgi:hypothetical protein